MMMGDGADSDLNFLQDVAAFPWKGQVSLYARGSALTYMPDPH